MILRTVIEGRNAAVTAINGAKSFGAIYSLNTLLSEMSKAYEEFTKKQNELVNKYGKDPDPKVEEEKQYNGNKFVPPNSENFTKFQKEINELLDTDIPFVYQVLEAKYFMEEKEIDRVAAIFLLPFFKKEEKKEEDKK